MRVLGGHWIVDLCLFVIKMAVALGSLFGFSSGLTIGLRGCLRSILVSLFGGFLVTVL